jgi:hypothetical protein
MGTDWAGRAPASTSYDSHNMRGMAGERESYLRFLFSEQNSPSKLLACGRPQSYLEASDGHTGERTGRTVS